MSRFDVKFLVRRYGWILLLIVVAFVGGTLVQPGGTGSPESTANTAPTRWTCSMHPQIILPSDDQQCPICFMDLIPLDDSGSADLAPEDLALTPQAVALAEITTVPVRRAPAVAEIALVGLVTADESRLRRITARVDGRLDELLVDTTGQNVVQGQALAKIYSPKMYTAQMELRSAVAAIADAADRSDTVRNRARATLQSSRDRLRLWGLSTQQIQEIESGADITEHLTVTSPTRGVIIERRAAEGDYVRIGSVLYAVADLSTVWVSFDALEADVALLRAGQDVAFTARAWPGRRFSGQVHFVDSVLNPSTRSVAVRVQVPNENGLLKPGMLVQGRVQILLDKNGDPVAPQDRDTAELPLLIPATAPLLTGNRALVYVRKPNEEDPVFSGRQVRLGPRVGDQYLVLTGLVEGELVVNRGNFKIDSALQIQARPSLMNPQHNPAPLHVIRPDCVHETLSELVTQYLTLQKALADDDDPTAQAAVAHITTAANAMDCDLASESTETRRAWTKQRTILATLAAKVGTAQTLASRRVAFEPLSDQLWLTLSDFSYAPLDPVRRFHCPMAFNDVGAHWLQIDKTTANPYFGDQMLRCGSQVAQRGGQQKQDADHE